MSAPGKLWIFVVVMAWNYWVSAPKSHQLAAAAENRSHCLQKFHFGCSAQTMPGRVNAHVHCVSSNILIHSCTRAATRRHAVTDLPKVLLLTHCSCLCFRSSTLKPQTYMTERTCHAASTVYTHSGTVSAFVFCVCPAVQSHHWLHSSADLFRVFKTLYQGQQTDIMLKINSSFTGSWVLTTHLTGCVLPADWACFTSVTFLWGGCFSAERHSVVRGTKRFVFDRAFHLG